MRNQTKWEVEAAGVNHSIEFKPGAFKSKIIVDGETYKVGSENKFIRLIDYGISFGKTDCKLVVIGNKVDLAVDGIFLGSKKTYEPVGSLPAWIWVLVGISTLGGMLVSGIVTLTLGLVMCILYIQFGIQKKIGAVIVSFITCTILQSLITFAIFSMRASF